MQIRLDFAGILILPPPINIIIGILLGIVNHQDQDFLILECTNHKPLQTELGIGEFLLETP